MSAKNNIIPVFVPHLGCPNNCVFCNQKRISGHKTPAGRNNVIEALDYAKQIGISFQNCELAFYGGSFTAIPMSEQEELLNAAQELVEAGGTLRLSTRPDCINTENLNMLKKYGVSTIELGCQSMDDEVLRLSGRGHTAEQTEKSAELVKQNGFNLILQMMTGLPGDTKEKTVMTAEKLCKLKPDGVRIYPTVIIHDTPLFDMWKAGKYREHTVQEAAEWCSEILPLFEESKIPVIRLGLNPSDELSGGEAAGGAYHPAFGEIVYSRILFNKAADLLGSCGEIKAVTIAVNPKCISQMTGQKKCNIIKLQSMFNGISINVVGDSRIQIREIALRNIVKS